MSHASIAGRGTFARGVHPPDMKALSCDAPVEPLPSPSEVKIPLLQHIGAPAVLAVKRNDALQAGDLIASAESFICAPVHSSISGKVGMVGPVTAPSGRRVQAVTIKAGDDDVQLEGQALYDDVLGGDWPTSAVNDYTPEQIVESVKAAGLVGLGGAAFPTFVKLLANTEKPIDTVLINGCECEPYLTADYRLMVESPGAAVCGAMLAAKALGAANVMIAVEDNKPVAIDHLKKAAKGTGVTIAKLHTKYPQGGEKQTIKASLHREIPGGCLPSEVGVAVINVGTAAAIAGAVIRGRPLTHRIVTVTGNGIVTPKNILAPIGAPVSQLIEFCGGLKEDTARIIAGGPMMGFAMGDLSSPVTKGTSGITVMTESETIPIPETSCVRCGRCVDACPMRLIPTRLALACRAKNWELTKQYHILSCFECGSCAYACPAGVSIVQLIRMGKQQMIPKK